MAQPQDDIDTLAERLLAQDRAALARAITLVESAREDHRAIAAELLKRAAGQAGAAQRIGVTGPPGAGKSTFIDAFGSMLTKAGERVAVLAVDPSSQRTHGSILGDKTRMAALSADPSAFIRPSPSSGALGGAGRKTRESALLCEAAGFSIVIIETVGVGQSETVVADMVDVFVALMQPGAGDELQGIKKGLLEVSDIILVNKADGELAPAAARAARDLSSALRIAAPSEGGWAAPVLTVSALEGRGLDELWRQIEGHRDWGERTGARDARRRAQRVSWLWAMLDEALLRKFKTSSAVRALIGELENQVASGALPASLAADQLLTAFLADN